VIQIATYLENTVRRFESEDLCYAHGTENARDEAVYLVLCTLGMPFDADTLSLQKPISPEQLELLDERVRCRIEKRIPVAYLVGKAWFAGHSFRCDERALIPRSPIAELIRNRFEPLLKKNPTRILDLCTGGGCIGIACALEFTQSYVDLVDISADALTLAAENVRDHRLGERVTTWESDLFASLPGQVSYDLLVCNPPYVAASELVQLPAEFKQEPRMGLFSEEQGLAIPVRILRQAADFLSPDGLLIMEVGSSSESLLARLGAVPLLWLEFEYGGDGVFALTAEQLQQYRESFS
jgi:ribosomal protein L3 glutamine methyltransferase|tara:strand:- start:92 stop:979 length:888 start_codon:yes stop_codon:yes gene_type:complete